MPRTLVGEVVHGNALSFNGTDQSAQRVGFTTATDNFTFNFTFTMWVQMGA